MRSCVRSPRAGSRAGQRWPELLDVPRRALRPEVLPGLSVKMSPWSFHAGPATAGTGDNSAAT
jgi:hypothetical protein